MLVCLDTLGSFGSLRAKSGSTHSEETDSTQHVSAANAYSLLGTTAPCTDAAQTSTAAPSSEG